MPNQAAFVNDRFLLENGLLASEVLEGYYKGNIHSRITLKVDISIAFDSVGCNFFLSTLQAYNVPTVFIEKIGACVYTPTFLVSIN